MDKGRIAGETAQRRANLRSKRARQRIVAGAVLAMVLAASATAGWFWLNRAPEIRELVVGAGPYRTDSHELMRDVAEVVARHSKNLRLKIKATSDSSFNISALNAGTVDLATIRSDTPVLSDVRTIADLFPDFFQIIARRDANIRDIKGLVGKRVAIPPFGTDEFRSFWILADHYDLPATGVKWIATPFNKAADNLLSGEYDAIFTVRSLRDRMLLDLFEDASLKKLPLEFVEIRQAEAIAIKRPFLGTGSIPQGTFDGSSPTPSRDMKSSVVRRILVARANVDASAIAELTRIIFENRLDLTIRFALASAISEPNQASGLSVPLHAGAASYYNRDEPSFLQNNAEPIALLVTLAAMFGSGLVALRSRFNNSQKNRIDSYNYILLDIADRARIAGTKAEIGELRSAMFDLLERVVRALDTDEVTEEGFQSFSLLFETVREAIRERMTELPSQAA
ncbi:MAG: TAXI family TRAP transporter solute-binding subunit [Nitratireductor sp.]|nr:TAXI family TRAP transporter solute-binding subunit [Nitratireductor sp.]MCB1456961.1 TAXI family TRAP transporter solute-binding subunit [Nitratireductor sp.]MCB1457764.1 TAXI family TRAP transporter solute-binding subunit [Nitratireductor sp.]